MVWVDDFSSDSVQGVGRFEEINNPAFMCFLHMVEESAVGSPRITDPQGFNPLPPSPPQMICGSRITYPITPPPPPSA